jgi:hypothetical protein
VEWWAWRINLALFAAALLALIAMLVRSPSKLVVAPLLIMAVTVAAGVGFVTHVPGLHLDEFRTAIAHGEKLLMVDARVKRVAEIEGLVRSHHPQAVAGGVGWRSEIVGQQLVGRSSLGRCADTSFIHQMHECGVNGACVSGRCQAAALGRADTSRCQRMRFASSGGIATPVRAAKSTVTSAVMSATV